MPERESAAEATAGALHELIMTGRLRPGARVNEADLAGVPHGRDQELLARQELVLGGVVSGLRVVRVLQDQRPVDRRAGAGLP